jgi:hypothetical protein
MPQPHILLDPSRERPPCPKCHGSMMFTCIPSGPAGFDLRTFECVMCSNIENVDIETKMMGWINSSGLRAPI